MNQLLPIINGSLFADILILLIVYYTPYFNSKFLMKWYESYRLSAIIADVFILIIGLIIAHSIYYKIFNKFTVFRFLLLLVVIQVIHDILFYIFFMKLPRGTNKMLDLFKDYAKEVGANAILGDTFMIIVAGLTSILFSLYSVNYNIIALIMMIYIIPFILYTK